MAIAILPASERPPGLSDLLIPAESFSDPHLSKAAAESALLPIERGIGAIGELMWQASTGGRTLSESAQKAIGMLLQHLAEYSELVGFIRDEAADVARREDIAAAARAVNESFTVAAAQRNRTQGARS